ncbi:MAG: endo-1,4-beta-xylanase, partial [Spirochaetales bacterium]|nr:endo-1,4-beta-xylanase [Spirochaetales bacterium]
MLKQNTILLILSVFLFSCATNKMVDSDMKDKQLVNDKENPIFYTYFPGLPIGVAVNTWEYFDESNKYNKLMKQFNGFVYENSMKMDAMQPTEGNFEFGNAKKLIKYAKDNNSVVRGHTLLWHNQYPNWFFKDIDGKDVSKDVLLKRIERHIKTIVTELKGEVKYWDVVNEVLEENGTLRNSKYLEIVGSEEYIAKAFQWAHESDPSAKLFINDYSICFSGAKQDGMYNLVKKLLAKGVPIHGVGLQSHINMSHPNVEDMRKTIKRFASLGLEVQVTELDISVYRSSSEKKMDITTDILLEQAERYRSLFEMFKEEAQNGNLTMVTLWGLSDDKTWLNDFPVKGRG